MFLTLQANDKRPIYQQITDGIKSLIAAGDLGEGMTLPSVRQVAGDLGINLNTVAVA
jgi:GntR family transcriptional regulator